MMDKHRKPKKELTEKQKRYFLYKQKKEMNDALTGAVFILLVIAAVLAIIDRSC